LTLIDRMRLKPFTGLKPWDYRFVELDQEVRAEVARSLGQMKRPESFEPLLISLKQHMAYHKKDLIELVAFRGIIEGLGEFGDRRAVPELIPLLQYRDKRTQILYLGIWDPPKVRAAAARALGKIGDTSAIPALSTALHDASQDVRDAAADALKKLNQQSIRSGSQ
jgi:HEAT repeat protein